MTPKAAATVQQSIEPDTRPAPTQTTTMFPDPWRPRLRDTVRLESTLGAAPRHLIYDSETGNYCQLAAGAAELAPLLDGTYSFGDLAGDGGTGAREQLTHFLVSLIELGFLERAGVDAQIQTAHRAPKRRRWMRLEYAWTGCAPAFAALRPLARALVSPVAAAVLLTLLVAGGWALTAVAGTVWSDASRTPTLGVAVGSVVAMVSLITLHEMAHGLALTRFGGRVDRVGLMLIYLLPAAFCDVSDGYRLPGRWRRVVVALAGIAVQLLAIASCAITLHIIGSGSDDLRQLLAVVLVLNATIVVANLIPFIRFDGYWALVAALDAPNLYTRGLAALGTRVRRLVEGRPRARSGNPGEDRPAPPGSSGGRALMAYGAACAATPPVLVLAALWQWNLLLIQLGAGGAVAWFALLGLSIVFVARVGLRRARTLSGLPLRQRLRAVALTLLVMTAAVTTAGLLVAATDQAHHLTHHMWEEPLHQIRL